MIQLLLIVSLLLAVSSTDSNNNSTIIDQQPARALAGGRKIPVTKCCSDETFYVLGFDQCKRADGKVDDWPPVVYSALSSRPIEVTADDFSLTTGLDDCPAGQIDVSTTQFRFFSDGSLRLDDGRRFKAGEFCLNQISVPVVFAARFCIPDPCNETALGCLRKCCPNNMAVNNTDRLCHPTSLPFEVSFSDENGQPVPLSPSSYIVRDGVVPKCNSDGYNLLSEQYGDVFYILPNGHIYMPIYPENDRDTPDYCIDNFVDEDGPVLQALTCFPPQPEETVDNQWALSIYPYFLFISALFLIATFVVYAILPEIRNIHGVTIMCHVASLAVMYIGMGIIQLCSYMPSGLCITMAVVTHFAFLSTFTWLNVMSFDIFWTFSTKNKPGGDCPSNALAIHFWMEALLPDGRDTDGRAAPLPPDNSDCDSIHSNVDGELRPRNTRHSRQQLGRRFIFYSLYAWGVPFIIVLVGQILDNIKNLPPNIVKPGFGQLKCWFLTRESFLAYLYGPVAVLILSNIVFFVMTIVLLYRASIDAAFAASSHHAKQKFRVIFSLFILMGVSWMMEIISFWVGGVSYIWIPTDILNILTGVFVFVIFVCKPNVWKLLKVKIPCLKKIDKCCPSFMLKRSDTSNSRLTSTMSKSQQQAAMNKASHEEAKRKVSLTTSLTAEVTQSTHIRESALVAQQTDDSADEVMINNRNSK